MLVKEADAYWYSNLTPAQQEAYEQFQSNLTRQGALHNGLDSRLDLLRFLKARQFNVEKAEHMYVEMSKWRVEQGVDELWEQREHVANEADRQVMRQHYPTFYHKTDRLGRPVYYELCGRSKPHKLVKAFSKETILKYHILQCEHFRRVKLPGCSKAAGRDIIQSVIVLDLDGLSYKQFSSEVMSILSTIATMDQDRFPEHLASMVLINTPFVFRSIWACVRPLLDERVQKKITILGADYSSTLLQVIPPENLPSFLGGQSQCDVTRDEGPWLQHADAKGCAQEALVADTIPAAVPSECTLVDCAVPA